MTGAGSASVAFVKADSFRAVPDSPQYVTPGLDPTIDDISLDNALERLRVPGQAEPFTSVRGQLEGAFAASWTLDATTHPQIRDIVFNDGGSGFAAPGPAATSRWYVGVEFLESAGATATAERVLEGVTPTDYELSYDADSNTVTESITAVYAAERQNSTLTPGSTLAASAGDSVPFHGLSLDIDGATVEKLQSATLSISNIARLQRGPQPEAVDAVIAAPEATLETEAIITDTDRVSLAYGSPSASETLAELGSVSGTLALESAGSTVATVTLPKLTPANYGWSNVVGGEDLLESTTFNADGEVSVS